MKKLPLLEEVIVRWWLLNSGVLVDFCHKVVDRSWGYLNASETGTPAKDVLNE